MQLLLRRGTRMIIEALYRSVLLSESWTKQRLSIGRLTFFVLSRSEGKCLKKKPDANLKRDVPAENERNWGANRTWERDKGLPD